MVEAKTAVSAGRYVLRLAENDADLERARALRWRCFRGGEGQDADAFDESSDHILVSESSSDRLVCTCRIRVLRNGAELDGAYTAQYYDLSGLAGFRGRMLEIGRFCIDPEIRDPDILRLVWAHIAELVQRRRIRLLFGCSSFHGTSPDSYSGTFALLRQRHLAPLRWMPGIRAGEVFRFATGPAREPEDRRQAMSAMPPLLRFYLGMGGWVSDHAVIDRQLGTLHVFTGLEVRQVRRARSRVMLNSVVPA
jgi:L-ornithine Nalpha-acyltransferase